MSHFTNWKVSQVSKSSLPCDNVRGRINSTHVAFAKQLMNNACGKRPGHHAAHIPEKQKEHHRGSSDPLTRAFILGSGLRVCFFLICTSFFLVLLWGQTQSNQPYSRGRKRAMCKDLTARRFPPRPPGTDWKLPTPLGPVYPPSISGQTATKAVGRSWELSPPTGKSFRMHDVTSAHLPQQGPFRHFMDMKAEKRLAGRKERRSRFGDINVHKCYQFGQVFRPFQALASTVLTKGFYFTYLHFLSTYQQRKSGTYPVPFREGPMEMRKNLEDPILNPDQEPGAFLLPAFSPPSPANHRSRLTDCQSRCLDGGSHHRGLA
ncbi:uncharacterized protein LOC141573517 [Camelus bactrianus]|uniref:Uncharacterized protein LOC141573517 n=1 Tax=Camelus bactrianus TaxID=9837 RepID=A0AC58NJM2_CAMBA